MSGMTKIPRSMVTVNAAAQAFTGYAIGLRVIGDVECIVIAATRQDTQAVLDWIEATPGDSSFACPVAMLQMRDVVEVGGR